MEREIVFFFLQCYVKWGEDGNCGASRHNPLGTDFSSMSSFDLNLKSTKSVTMTLDLGQKLVEKQTKRPYADDFMQIQSDFHVVPTSSHRCFLWLQLSGNNVDLTSF